VWEAHDPSRIDLRLDSRAVTFENPSGARGAGGSAAHGRKGSPSREISPGETVVLADLEGPGTIRHVWMTFPPRPPEEMRGLFLEVFYDGASEPSVSVPCLDFFGLPLGRPVHFVSALAAAHEGRGFNAYFPIPFRRRVRMELTNGSARPTPLYYQLDYTLDGALPDETGLLHAVFQRENPTRMGQDFTIARDFRGPGRFLGCNVGIRTLPCAHFTWYGEGEVKIYRDGDADLPTICGTGLEDYVGSAWGMGPHFAHWAGAPLEVRDPEGGPVPDFVSFYRWHVPDPVIFARELRVTIQQIGYAVVGKDDEAALAEFERTNPPAGTGWTLSNPALAARGIAERTAYVYTREAQPVPRLDPEAALADIERRAYESPSGMERLLAAGS
jgi:hypothetical protein